MASLPLICPLIICMRVVNGDRVPAPSSQLEHGGLSITYDANVRAFPHTFQIFSGVFREIPFWFRYFPFSFRSFEYITRSIYATKSGIIRTFTLNDVAIAQRIRCHWCHRRQYGEYDFGVFSTHPRKVVLWVRPSTPKPFQVPEKTPCCGRVTTKSFRPKIIDICQNSLMANHPNCHIENRYPNQSSFFNSSISGRVSFSISGISLVVVYVATPIGLS